MKNTDLHLIWKKIDSKMESKSVEEINSVLSGKINKAMFSFYTITIFTVLVTVGFCIFLILTMLNRWADIYYRINNLTICILTVIALVTELLKLIKLRKNKADLSLKEWLGESIKLFNKELKYRISYYILPLIAIPSILSIHIYYSQDSFVNLFKDEESIYGLIFGLISGIIVGYIFIIKYRKHQLKQLKFLKSLYSHLCNQH